MRHFTSSIIMTFLGFFLAYYFWGMEAFYIVFLLSILEISLSFDNAVVNAKILESMDPIWQQRFITYGIPIAVFGMRFLFPVVIVAIASGLTVGNTFTLAIYAPEQYQEILSNKEVHNLIYAFGGSFLLMVFLGFLFDEERDVKWLHVIESNRFIKKIAEADHTETIISLGLGIFLISHFNNASIAVAYLTGIILYHILITFDELMNSNGVRNGVVGLLYLEVLDASFSFDGVIGAFALSSNLFLIMIGLGIGAMFVRSLTLYMVEKKTLDEYMYLEHGAHYAILALALIMFINMTHYHLNEVFVGTIGITFISSAVIYSIYEKRKTLS